jgi:hypothetical protein
MGKPRNPHVLVEMSCSNCLRRSRPTDIIVLRLSQRLTLSNRLTFISTSFRQARYLLLHTCRAHLPMSAVKRTACDRCHGQKMRCIREETRAKCNRCMVVNAECVFGMARKAGRPPASVHTPAGGINRAVPTQIMTPTRSEPSPRLEDDVLPSLSNPSTSISTTHTRCYSSDDISLMSTAQTMETPLSDISLGHGTDFQTLWTESFLDIGVGSFESLGQNEDYEFMEEAPLIHRSHAPSSSNSGPDQFELRPQSRPTIASNAMQQLSELSAKLFTPISPRIASDSNTIDAKIGWLEQLISHVITSSVAFHKILSTVVPSFETSPDGTAFLEDTATILQILTTYICLTQLHHAMYLHVQSILQPSPSTANPFPFPSPFTSTSNVPVAFPSLKIGGLSLSSYPKFQWKFLLQICVHHLGEVEALLGLPPGLCVSEDGMTGAGILRQDTGQVSPLIRAVMAENEVTVKGIRRVLADLRESLRGSIQI